MKRLQDNSGWMHLNVMSGTVEIWLTTNDEPTKKLYITPHKLERIDLIECVRFSMRVQPVHFILKKGESLMQIEPFLLLYLDSPKLHHLLQNLNESCPHRSTNRIVKER